MLKIAAAARSGGGKSSPNKCISMYVCSNNAGLLSAAESKKLLISACMPEPKTFSLSHNFFVSSRLFFPLFCCCSAGDYLIMTETGFYDRIWMNIWMCVCVRTKHISVFVAMSLFILLRKWPPHIYIRQHTTPCLCTQSDMIYKNVSASSSWAVA